MVGLFKDKSQTTDRSNAKKLKTQTLKELKDLANQELAEQNALINNASYKLVDINEIRYCGEVSMIF